MYTFTDNRKREEKQQNPEEWQDEFAFVRFSVKPQQEEYQDSALSIEIQQVDFLHAEEHEQRLQEAAGSLVPVHVFHEMRTRGVAPLAELMAQQRDFIGSRLEAAGRPRFYEAWDEWAREWNRKIDDLNAEINGLLNHV